MSKSKEERKRERERIKAMYHSSPGYFGFQLDHECPIVVCDCIAFIRNRGLYDTGIFRIPGNHDVVQELKKKYNAAFSTKEDKLNSSASVLNAYRPAPSVNDIASLLKAFFQDLPGPIIPEKITMEMVEITKQKLPTKKEGKLLSRCLRSIPRPQRECLSYLISFLREICSFRKFNQMNAENLSTCFTLSLMKSMNPATQLFLVGNGAVIIKKLISTSVDLSMPSVTNVRDNTRYKDVVIDKKPQGRDILLDPSDTMAPQMQRSLPTIPSPVLPRRDAPPGMTLQPQPPPFIMRQQKQQMAPQLRPGESRLRRQMAARGVIKKNPEEGGRAGNFMNAVPQPLPYRPKIDDMNLPPPTVFSGQVPKPDTSNSGNAEYNTGFNFNQWP